MKVRNASSLQQSQNDLVHGCLPLMLLLHGHFRSGQLSTVQTHASVLSTLPTTLNRDFILKIKPSCPKGIIEP